MIRIRFNTIKECDTVDSELNMKLHNMTCTNEMCKGYLKDIRWSWYRPFEYQRLDNLTIEGISFNDKICCDVFRDDLYRAYWRIIEEAKQEGIQIFTVPSVSF